MEQYLTILPQVLIDGLILGFVYAMVALGYTMVYGVLEFINFAHSEIFMVGAFAGVEVLLALKRASFLDRWPLGFSLLLAILIAMAIAGLLGVSVERVAYRPLRNAPRLVPLISAIGVSFLLQDLVRIVEGLWHNAFYRTAPPLFVTADGQIQRWRIAEIPLQNGQTATVELPYKSLLTIGVSLFIMLALTLFVNRTKLGKAIRAVAQDQATASLMGINVNGIIALTFLIGAALGGAAGMLFGLQFPRIDPFIGFILGLKAFTAAVFGGIGNIPGAMLGGVLLGIFESLGSAYLGPLTGGVLGTEYKDVFAFVLLIGILIFKPAGLLGEAVGEKV